MHHVFNNRYCIDLEFNKIDLNDSKVTSGYLVVKRAIPGKLLPFKGILLLFRFVSLTRHSLIQFCDVYILIVILQLNNKYGIGKDRNIHR